MRIIDKVSLYHDQTKTKIIKKFKKVNLIVINVLRI